MAFATTIGAENLLKTATVVASSDATNAPNLWDSLLTDFWSPSAGAQALTIDHGSAKAIDYLGIAGHNLGTDSASVVIAWSDDDISYTTIATLNPTDDLVIFNQFTSVSHRYTKITVTGTASKIARINIGATVDLSGTLNTPFTEPKDSGEYKFRTSVTELGLPAARSVKHASYSFSMVFRNVLPSWVDSSWPAIYEAIRNDAFFLLWDADGHSDDPVFAWLVDDSQPTHSDVTYMSYSLDCMCVL